MCRGGVGRCVGVGWRMKFHPSSVERSDVAVIASGGPEGFVCSEHLAIVADNWCGFRVL